MRQEDPRYLEPTLVAAQEDDVLELDELWSYVGSKKSKVWIWIALCRRTRQVVAWHPGPRDKISCRQLWDKIPPPYKRGQIFTDFYASYGQVVPEQQHYACAKQDGQTNHVERFNLTLRNRLGRLVRKSLSFSKRHLHHYIQIRLFLIRYNLHIKNTRTPAI